MKNRYFALLAALVVVGLVGSAFAESRHSGRYTRDEMVATDDGVAVKKYEDPELEAFHNYVYSHRVPKSKIGSVSSLTPGTVDTARGFGGNQLSRIDLTWMTGAFAGTAASGSCFRPAISANGDFVVYGSLASNIVPGDVNGYSDVFRHQISTGETLMVSTGDGAAGMQEFIPVGGYHWSVYENGINSNGTLVSFTSTAPISAGDDTEGFFWHDVYVANMTVPTSIVYTRVSTDDAGAGDNNGRSFDGVISDDGSAVVFVSKNDFGNASDLNAVVNGGFDVFWKNTSALPPAGGDLVSDLRLVSHANGNADATPNVGGTTGLMSGRPDVSADGRYVVYDSTQFEITGQRSNRNAAVYVWDRDGAAATNNTMLSVNSDGSVNNAANYAINPSISPDGNWVSFAGNIALTPGAVAANTNYYVRTRTSAITMRRPNTDSTGLRIQPLVGRMMSNQVNNAGNVLFSSADSMAITPALTLFANDDNFSRDVMMKVFTNGAPVAADDNAGNVFLISQTPGGVVGVRDELAVGSFFGGSMDCPFGWTNNGSNDVVVFASSKEELDATNASFGLKNIFVASLDGSNAVTAMTKISEGDAAVDATISFGDGIYEKTVFTPMPSVSADGQWLASSTLAKNMFDSTEAFNTNLDISIENQVIMHNLVTGQAVIASRNPDGTALNSSFLVGFANNHFDIDLRTNPAAASPNFTDGVQSATQSRAAFTWDGVVGNGGSSAVVSLGNFAGVLNPDPGVFPPGAAGGTGRHLIVANSAAGTTRVVQGTPMGLNGAISVGFTYNGLPQTAMSGNGRFVAFSSNGELVNAALGDAWFRSFRLDLQSDSIIAVSIGQTGQENDGDCPVVDITDNGNQVVFCNLGAFNISVLGAGDPTQAGQNYLRDVTAAETRLISSNAAGVPGGNATFTAEYTAAFPASGAISGDGSIFAFVSQADNLVPGYAGDDFDGHMYVKRLNGDSPDTGPVIVLTTDTGGNPMDLGNPDPNLEEFIQRAGMSTDGEVVAFSANAADFTLDDTNGMQWDAFAATAISLTGTPSYNALTIASKALTGEQSIGGSAVAVAPFSRTGVQGVAFVLDGGDIPTWSQDEAAAAYGASASMSHHFVRILNAFGTAAESSWELFE